ncbi:MAG TPA: calcium/proton exchanger [Anaerolineaceae bacterium]|nr:calcium/proton exchanger [Anaerolineaceae bacterium]
MVKTLAAFFAKNPLNWLILAFPLALLARWGNWGDVWVFILSAVGVIPLSGWIGEATEAIAVHTGPKIGGLLNATLGNAAELIITLVAIRAGLLELVKASITGSILGNLLFVMGFSMLLGGARHGVQRFDRKHVGQQAVLLTLSVVALVIPSLFSHSIGPEGSSKVEALSLGVAAVMIILYILGIVYSLRDQKSPITYSEPAEQKGAQSAPVAHWSIRTAVIFLALATVGVVVLSELLVGAVEPVVRQLGLSEFFLGIILIPIIGNVAEHLVAVRVAMRNQMELSVEIAMSSSLQIALFVAPLLVFISLMIGNPLTLIFNLFELLALVAAVLIAALVASDGESNWLEGAALLGVYLILSIAFFLMPASAL